MEGRMFYLITYSSESVDRINFSIFTRNDMELWKGTIVDWIKQAIGYGENRCLLNAQVVSEAEYQDLVDSGFYYEDTHARE